MKEIKTISIDIETFSDIDLSKCGVYKYSESENFEILLFAYSINHEEVQVVDLALGEKIPEEVIKALVDDKVIKWAYNANFERVCLSRYISRYYPEYFISYSIDEDTVNEFLDPSSWRCSMIWSAYLGLPLSLAGVGAVLGLEEQKREDIDMTSKLAALENKYDSLKKQMKYYSPITDSPEMFLLILVFIFPFVIYCVYKSNQKKAIAENNANVQKQMNY